MIRAQGQLLGHFRTFGAAQTNSSLRLDSNDFLYAGPHSFVGNCPFQQYIFLGAK